MGPFLCLSQRSGSQSAVKGNLEGGVGGTLRGTTLTANGMCMRIHLFPIMPDIKEICKNVK